MRIAFVNIQSLKQKATDLECSLVENSENLSLICLAETWLNINDSIIPQFSNFYHIYQQRKSSIHGGVSILIGKRFKFDSLILGDLHTDFVFECVGVRLFCHENTAINVYCIYRAPSTNVYLFFKKLEELLTFSKNTMTILCGDFNIDLLKDNTISNDFYEIMHKFNLNCAISSPTRVTESSQSLIDNIIYSDLLALGKVFDLLSIIPSSDHNPIGCSFLLPQNPLPNPRTTTKIPEPNPTVNMSIPRLNSLYYDIYNTSWDVFDSNSSLDDEFSFFCKTFSNKVKYHCKASNKKQHCQINPWMSKRIVQYSKMKRKLHVIYKATRAPQDKINYSEYARYLKDYINICKRQYYESKINESKNLSKTCWNILTQIRGKTRRTLPNELTFEGETYREDNLIANAFNKFFAKSMTSNNNTIFYPSTSNQNASILTPTNVNEVTNVIHALKPKCSTGSDGIPVQAIKYCLDVLSSHISDLINKSFHYAVYPKCFKVNKVIPIFKNKGSINSIENYRPISLQSVISKIIEKIVYFRLASHFNDLLSDKQFGFRKHKSTIDALLTVTEFVYQSLNDNDHAACMFIDIKKAFDSLDHASLLAKLENYNLSTRDVLWMKSYLTERKQYVQLSNTTSDLIDINSGVPQGSILGPLLFIIYVNDLFTSLPYNLIMFADDVTACLKNKTQSGLMYDATNCVKQIHEWTQKNHLEIQTAKTELLNFNTPINIGLIFNEEIIYSSSSVKLLGVMIDKDLNWIPHMKNIIKKISKSIFLMKQLSNFITPKALRCMYFGLVHTHLQYAICCYCFGSARYMKKIFALQCEAVSLIYKPRDGSDNCFKQCKVFTVYSLAIYNTMKFCIEKNLLPDPKHSVYNTRNADKLPIPAVKKESFRRSLAYTGAKILNWLPEDLKTDIERPIFFRRLKAYLLDQAFTSYPNFN